MFHKNNHISISILLLFVLALTSFAQIDSEVNSGRANQKFSDGRALEDRAELERAYEAYREAFELDPTHYRSVYRAGRILHRLGRMPDAIAAMQTALDIAPDFYPAHNTMGLLLADTGFLNAAVEAYRKGVDAAPDMAAAWRNYSRALAETGDIQQAATSYERAVELDPTHESSIVALGVLQGRLGQRETAVATLQKAFDINPGNMNAVDAMAWVVDQDRALLDNIPDNLRPSGDSDAAVIPLAGGSYTTSGLYRPPTMLLDSPVKLRDQGVRLVHQGHYALGMQVLEQARRYGEQDPILFSELGYAHFQLGRYEGAAWAYGMAAEQSVEPVGWHRLNQALALREAGDLPGSEKAVKRAIDLDPGLAHAHYLYGLILLEQKKVARAGRSFRNAAKLDPRNVSVHLALAATMATRGQEKDAIKTYRNALRVSPGDQEALYHLAALLEQEGKKSEALDAYEALALATANDPEFESWNVLANQKVKELAYAISQESVDVAESSMWDRLKFWTD
jgi:protein O-GlcNAc transferase